MADFTIPDFLQNMTAAEIIDGMIASLPDDIDASEGSHTWNFLMPTALVAAYLGEYVLPQVVQLIFPEWSYGEYLDAHAQARGLTRKAATAATGEITITGAVGTVIPQGSVFSTASANNDDPSIDYETQTQVTIPAEGTVTVAVQCTQTGTIGNTGIGTVILLSSRITGVTSVTNESAITGGTDEEDDASLIERIEEYDTTQGESFTGNIADYKRWAMSVDGVGDATVVPANDDTGLVTIVLTDANGDPATEELCTAVYNYIMSPDDPGSRLAPINAYLQVEAPDTTAIGVKATVELTDGATIESVQAAFLAQLTQYLPTALDDEEIKITRVAALLSATEGVNDFADLQIGTKSGGIITYGTTNIALTADVLPTIALADIVLTSGTVGN